MSLASKSKYIPTIGLEIVSHHSYFPTFLLTYLPILLLIHILLLARTNNIEIKAIQ